MSETDGPSAQLNLVAIKKFCGDCHAFPQPSTFPAHLWPTKVEEGFEFYARSGRRDLTVPDLHGVVDYYVSEAPETLQVVHYAAKAPTSSAIFGPAEEVVFGHPIRAVATIQKLPRGAELVMPNLFLSDMRSGWIWRSQANASGDEIQLERWLQCLNPARVTPARLEAGPSGHLVCDLGSFFPEDHALGRVIYVKPSDDASNEPQTVDIAFGLGRVADARPLDADNDGDMDVVVAEFGWRDGGSILLLRNTPDDKGQPVFATEKIDPRHGAIHVPVMDLDNDGDDDFVALVSQEFEEIVAYLNRGDGSFEKRKIFEADNPSYGSSGIEPADLDNDGDIDFVFVNGDSLDTPIAKPYHSVQWLENTGEFPFVHHSIAKMPGAHCVKVADIDLDGDQDVAVSVLLPTAALTDNPAANFDSIAWFEQRDDGHFVRHQIESDECLHAACELVDWDSDGDLDLITGDFARDADADRPLKLYRNTVIR